MQKVIKEYEVYKFNELPDNIKDKVIADFYDFNVCYDWWDFTYDDAKNIGLEITEFDIDRGNMVHGNLLESCVDVAKLIFKNHGQNCDTYKLAKEFIKDRHNAKNENEIESIEKDFEYQLKEEYLSMLRQEYEYLTSEEVIKETIDANEYEFTIDGKIFNQ